MTDTAKLAKKMAWTMLDLMRTAVNSVSNSLSADVETRVKSMVPAFNKACENLEHAPITIVVFHLELEKEHQKIEYLDVSIDQGRIDYKSILTHHFKASYLFNPGVRIIYITGEHEDIKFVPEGVIVVRLPLESKWLMYERVVALTAYTQSKAFSSNTVMLDSDAIPNYRLSRVFELPFDIALTYRQPSSMMSINEGVIFVAHRPDVKAKDFFIRYLATYEVLCNNAFVLDTYKDIRRWRGGQLALNGAGKASGHFSEFEHCYANGALVRYLDSTDYNFTVRLGESYTYEQLMRKYVLHLKGPNKPEITALIKFQDEWHKAVDASFPPQ
jgi:hypothetical protein